MVEKLTTISRKGGSVTGGRKANIPIPANILPGGRGSQPLKMEADTSIPSAPSGNWPLGADGMELHGSILPLQLSFLSLSKLSSQKFSEEVLAASGLGNGEEGFDLCVTLGREKGSLFS